jgi:UDP:flavonoid glycosyltransferase YjiC (YdhE family)
MNVLVHCIPQAGHVNPLMPMLTAFVDGGDRVVVATGDAVRRQVEDAGAEFRPAGHGMETWFATLAGRTRGAPGDGLPPSRILHYFAPRLFAEVAADDMVDDVVAAAEDVRPDVVVFDTAALLGPLVAKLVDARAVHHAFGPLFDADVLQLCTDAMSPLWRTFGLDVPADAGVYDGLTVTICPPSMEPHRPPNQRLRGIRPVPLPVRESAPQSPPLVYFSLGTLWADPSVVATVFAAVADAPVRVLATLGGLEGIPTPPDNVDVRAFVPQAEVLPEASLVVHHAGAGTMFGALAHGLPQVALPQAADNFVNAELLRRRGVATVLQPAEVTAQAVRAALDVVLTEPSYADAAREVAAEIAALPSAADVAVQLRAG